MVTAHPIAAAPLTMLTVLVLPVPVQPALHATRSVGLAGVAVSVTVPAGNLAVQGAAEVQALMPAGELVTLPLPSTVTVRSVGITVVIVAVQVAGVPITISTLPVLPVPVQSALQATVSVGLGVVAANVTVPAENFAVQGAAEVQALMPAGVLVRLPLPTIVTVKSEVVTGGGVTPVKATVQVNAVIPLATVTTPV